MEELILKNTKIENQFNEVKNYQEIEFDSSQFLSNNEKSNNENQKNKNTSSNNRNLP